MRKELKEVIGAYREMERIFFSSTDTTSDQYLAGKSFFYSVSFRLGGGDKWLGFREMLRCFRKLIHRTDAVFETGEGGKSAIIGNNLSIRKIITEYISRSSDEPVCWYISKELVLSMGVFSLGNYFFMLPFALRQSFKAMNPEYRAAYALSIREVAEIAVILNFSKKNGLERIYDFVPYEKDSNFMSGVLMKNGISVVKIPSSGPLSTHNKILISDEVVFSSHYHFEEYEKMKDTIRVKKIREWVPERAFTYLEIYRNHPVAPRKTIGFYSHGEWLRKAEKHSDNGLNSSVAETRALFSLGEFARQYPEYDIVIFPHPREKRRENVTAAAEHYNAALSGIPYRITDNEVPTAMSFHQVDIAVVAFSTIIFERLFCGYKLLINNYGIEGFPMQGSPLCSICYNSPEELKELIITNSELTDDEFFEKYNLGGYRISPGKKYQGWN
ncbi:MAG: hypothetical protein IT223_07385 [Crocinitomicaceae bacterium]|nr:hypothetical protein [Crocinitomicaceae bacterium]